MTNQKPRKARRGRPRTDPRIRARIADLHEAGYNMRGIEVKLDVEGDRVSYNTIRSLIASNEVGADSAATWCLTAAPGLADDHPDVVLEVLSGVLEVTGGRVSSVGTRVADWIAALRLADPGLHPWSSYVLARRYFLHELQKKDLRELDQVLLYAGLYRKRRSADFDENLFEDANLSTLLYQVAWPGLLAQIGIGLRVAEGGAPRSREPSKP
jgi:hypothetical protein